MMKKILILIGLCVSGSLLQAQTTNNVTKVTYFPISYVNYHDVNANNLDIGVGRKQATGSVGTLNVQVDTELGSKQTLQLMWPAAETDNVILNPNSTDIDNVTIGENQPGSAEGTITFNGELQVGNNSSFGNLNVNEANIAGLKLFGKDFPACGEGEMHWVKLKLGPNDGCAWYLMCGSLEGLEECTLSEGLSVNYDLTEGNFVWKRTLWEELNTSNHECPSPCMAVTSTEGYEVGNSETLPANFWVSPCSSPTHVGKNKCSGCKDNHKYVYTCSWESN